MRRFRESLCALGIVAALFASAVVGTAQTAPPDEKEWFQAFLKWAPLLPADVPAVRIEPMYKDVLRSHGLTVTAIDRRWTAIQKQQRQSEEWLRMSTNRNYAQGWYDGKPPSKFLVEWATGKKPGSALDCGMGAGRNSVFLASLGWDVTGMDISDTAVEKANALAAKNGVKIKTVRGSFRDFAWGKDRWDLILNIDSWDGEGERPSTFAAAPLYEALRVGGILYIESHLPTLQALDMPLLKSFAGFHVLEHALKPDPDWQGRYKNGVLVFVAKR